VDPVQTPNDPSARKAARRGGAGVAIVVAVGVVLVLSMALVAFYSSYVADTNRQSIASLQSQLRQLSDNEQLIAAQLASQGSASSPATATGGKASASASASKATTGSFSAPVQVAPQPSSQPKVTGDQAAQGIRVVLGKVVKSGALTGTGVAISFRPGGYYEGSIAFSVAASHGDVLKGSYYVDGTSTRTIDAHVLTGADVSVYGWNGSAPSKSSAIHTADLAKVLVGGAAAKDPWKSAWYWFEIGPGMAIVKVSQLPRP
jgi:hypothetical protein